jgi:hypothetical protein
MYVDTDDEDFSHLPTVATLSKLAPQIAKRAQKVYDRWHQDEDGFDEEVGGGGICHLIADDWCELLAGHGFACVSFHGSVGENHIWVIAQTQNGVFSVDINPFNYETGGGYCWRKIPGVVFNASMVEISRISPFPSDFNEYADEVY